MRITLNLALFFLVSASPFVSTSDAAFRTEVVRQTAVSTVHDGIYRAAVCPSGVVFVTNSDGEITVLGSDGSVILSRTGVGEVRGATASTCDHRNLVYVAAEGWVRVYEASSGGDVVLQRSIWIEGGPTRLLVTPSDELYVLGPAWVNDRPVLLRRFQLPDGAFLGVVPIDVALRNGRTFNQLVYRGSLFWHPARKQVVYVPANPMKLWCINDVGQIDEVIAPVPGNFDEAGLPAEGAGLLPVWRHYDQVFNALVLPSGRVYFQVMKGRGIGGVEPGKSYMHLRSLESSLAASPEMIPTDDLP